MTKEVFQSGVCTGFEIHGNRKGLKRRGGLKPISPKKDLQKLAYYQGSQNLRLLHPELISLQRLT